MANFHSRSNSLELASLVDLNEEVKNLVRITSIQQVLSHDQCGTWINEILEGSLGLVDLCGFSREVVCSMKEYIQDLESFIRTSLEDNNNLQALMIVMKRAEAISFSVLILVLLSLSGANGRSKPRRWPLLSKFTQTNPIFSETDRECGSKDLFDLHVGASMKCMDNVTVQSILKKLKDSEMTIHEFEDGLESLFRSLVKTRVSLLNILSDH
ncbi:uncharacterized protein [Primulina eburnea]|uniref:uncharacterized protein n=1 Tax=Primulina eburnea TaxID=1245227 RepID=UPI003C6C900D